MRALLTSLILLSAAEGAAAHVPVDGQSVAQQLAHQFSSPHHAFLLLCLGAAAVTAFRWYRGRRQDTD